jgi:hypothetical protein
MARVLVAVGYLAYSLGRRGPCDRPPVSAGVVALLVGTQAPDLIDEPLVMWLRLLSSGRRLGHSLLFLATGTVVLEALGHRFERREVAVDGDPIIGRVQFKTVQPPSLIERHCSDKVQ